MGTEAGRIEIGWAPTACTLPTEERPLRAAEFDELFGSAVRVERRDATRLRLALEPTPEVARRYASLAVRETECCSFFTFALTATNGELWLDITVPEAHVAVLDGMQARGAR